MTLHIVLSHINTADSEQDEPGTRVAIAASASCRSIGMGFVVPACFSGLLPSMLCLAVRQPGPCF